MTMFKGDDLKRMRETQHEALPDEVTIKRNVRSDDGFGGTSVTSQQTIATDVPCRFFPGQMEEVLGQMARQQERNVYTFRFKKDADVQDKDVLVLQSDSTEYKVERIKSPRSYQNLLTVEAERFTS